MADGDMPAAEASAALPAQTEQPALPWHLLLELDEATADQLKRDAGRLLGATRRPVARKLRQVFWDTADHRIARAGLALASQMTGQRQSQLILDIRPEPGAGRIVHQINSPSTSGALDTTRLAFMPGVDPALVNDVEAVALVPLFGVDLNRTVWQAECDGSRILVTLERAVIEAAAGHAATIQLDLALMAGPTQGLYTLAHTLAEALPVRLARRDTVQQGMKLATGKDPVTPPGEPELFADMTVRAGLLAIGRSAAADLRKAITLLAEATEPETIHQARVAIRRLRSVLSVFRAILPPSTRRRFSRSLGDLGHLMGQAREWDVWLVETVAPLHAALGAEPILDELSDAAADLRTKAARVLAVAVAGPRLVTLSLELGAWFDAGLWPEPPTGAEAVLLDRPLADFARDLLTRRHKKLVQATHEKKSPDSDELHRIRIEAKMLRYTADFLRSLFPAKKSRAYLGALKDIQEILGAAHDAAVARNLVAMLATKDPSAGARAAGLIAGWTAAEAVAAQRRFAKAWETFLETKRFWKD